MSPVSDGVFEAVSRVNRDMLNAARMMDRLEAKYIVDLYYQCQDFRKASANQQRSLSAGESDNFLSFIFTAFEQTEKNIRRGLDKFSSEYRIGNWLRGITGIGPVIAAGLLAHLDIRRAPTAGCFWRFAGLDANDEWIGAAEARTVVNAIMGEAKKPTAEHIDAAAARIRRRADYIHRTAAFLSKKESPTISKDMLIKVLSVRPWNAALKTLIYKAEDSFAKFQNHDDDYYGKLYVERKRHEIEANRSGRNVEAARKALADKNIGKDTDAYVWYAGCLPSYVLDGWELISQEGRTARVSQLKGAPGSGQPMLPPAHIHMRAMRWTGKLFLSHVHHAMYVDFYGKEPPKPYVFDHVPTGHRHFIPLPNWPYDGDGKPLTELFAERVRPTIPEE